MYNKILIIIFLLPFAAEAVLPTGADNLYTAGRGNDNHLMLGKQDKTISRVHAEIRVKPA